MINFTDVPNDDSIKNNPGLKPQSTTPQYLSTKTVERR